MDDTEKLITALNRIADEIAAHLAWMRDQKEAANAKRTQLPPNDYRPSPLLAGQFPRRDGNIYGNGITASKPDPSNANPETGDLRSPNQR